MNILKIILDNRSDYMNRIFSWTSFDEEVEDHFDPRWHDHLQLFTFGSKCQMVLFEDVRYGMAYVIEVMHPKYVGCFWKRGIDSYVGSTDNPIRRTGEYLTVLELSQVDKYAAIEYAGNRGINKFLAKLMVELPKECFRIRWQELPNSESVEPNYINCADESKTGIDNTFLLNIKHRKGPQPHVKAETNYKLLRCLMLGLPIFILSEGGDFYPIEV